MYLDYQSQEKDIVGDEFEVQDLYLILKQPFLNILILREQVLVLFLLHIRNKEQKIGKSIFQFSLQKIRSNISCIFVELRLGFFFRLNHSKQYEQYPHQHCSQEKLQNELQDYFKEMNQKFDFHPCEEGGEFESFNLFFIYMKKEFKQTKLKQFAIKKILLQNFIIFQQQNRN